MRMNAGIQATHKASVTVTLSACVTDWHITTRGPYRERQVGRSQASVGIKADRVCSVNGKRFKRKYR